MTIIVVHLVERDCTFAIFLAMWSGKVNLLCQAASIILVAQMPLLILKLC